MTYNVYPPTESGDETYGAFINTPQSQLPADLRGASTSEVLVSFPPGQYIVEQYGDATTSITTNFGAGTISGTQLGTSAKFFDIPNGITRVFSMIPETIDYHFRGTATASTIFGLFKGDGLYLSLGGDATSSNIMTSTNNITWTNRTSATTNRMRAGVYGNNTYVAVGVGAIQTSTNGISWTVRTSGFGSSSINGVTFGNGIFVAVGDMSPGTGGGAICISTDGITWSTRIVNLAINDKSFASVTFGNGIFAAGRNGVESAVYTSTDGLTWTTRATGMAGNTVQSIAFGNGTFVVCDEASPRNVRSSTDAITWTTRTLPGQFRIDDITFGNNAFYAAGQNSSFLNQIWYSTNGATWTQNSLPAPTFSAITNRAILADNNFVILAGNLGAFAYIYTTTRTGANVVQATIFSKVDLNEQIVQ